MNTSMRSSLIGSQLPGLRCRVEPIAVARYSTTIRMLQVARRNRERVLAVLALMMLVVAWDATLRLDQQMSPPRMRLSHGVEVDGDPQGMTALDR